MGRKGVTYSSLAKALRVSQGTIKNWTNPGKTQKLSPEMLDKLCLCFGVGGTYFENIKEDVTLQRIGEDFFDFSHPHLDLLRQLEADAVAGTACEVVGLPGMFKSQVLIDLRKYLARRNPVDRKSKCFWRALAAEDSIERFWSSLGKEMMGQNGEQYEYSQVQDFMRSTRSILLLDDADQFLINVRKRLSDPRQFELVGPQWITNLQNLGGGVIASSTIAMGDQVPITTAGYSSARFIEIAFKNWCQPSEWDLWTTGQLIRTGTAESSLTEQINETAEQIPLVFEIGLKALKAHNSSVAQNRVEAIQRTIAECIWNRLPERAQNELKLSLTGPSSSRGVSRSSVKWEADSSLYFARDSVLQKALIKAGVCAPVDGSTTNVRVRIWKDVWNKAVVS